MLSKTEPVADTDDDTWVIVSATYFEPLAAGRLSDLEDLFGSAKVRGPWAIVELAHAFIAEPDYPQRQLALDAFMRDAASASDDVTRIVGRRSTREEGFISLQLTLHTSEAVGGVSFPEWFLARIFAQPAEFNIS